MADSKKIWLTRPQEDSEHFAAELAYHQIESIVAPVMYVVEKKIPELPQKPNALLLTSRHAASALMDLPADWRSLPVFCVGAATANYARDYHYKNILAGNSDIMGLLPRIMAQLRPSQTILYLAGDETRTDIPTLLSVQGIHVTTLYVYQAIAQPLLPAMVKAALREGTVSEVTFFSPRSASIACRLMREAEVEGAATQITAYCLSLNVAKEAAALPWANFYTSHQPTRRAMREMILSHRKESR